MYMYVCGPELLMAKAKYPTVIFQNWLDLHCNLQICVLKIYSTILKWIFINFFFWSFNLHGTLTAKIDFLGWSIKQFLSRRVCVLQNATADYCFDHDCVIAFQMYMYFKFKLCKLVKLSYKSSNYFVCSNQNKLYPSRPVTLQQYTTQTLARKTFVSE